MITMTSLEAQNQFGTLIDSSQREPIVITRRGRPVSVVTSYQDYQRESQVIPYLVAKMISETYPLRGKEAGDAMRKHLSTMSTLAEEEGLTEDDVNHRHQCPDQCRSFAALKNGQRLDPCLEPFFHRSKRRHMAGTPDPYPAHEV